MRFLALAVLSGLIACPALAAPGAAPAAAKIISGDTLVLNNGEIVRLAGIEAPFAETDALAGQARAYLQSLTAGRALALEDASTDRYGRTAADVYAVQNDGRKIRLQGEMLKAGFAFIYPPRGDEPELAAMFKLESEARRGKRGIWADPAYADTPAARAAAKYGHFAFVTGAVLQAARVKNKIYLNFGADWRDDFTIAIAAHDLKNFRAAAIDPLAYQGKTIRARGWVKRDFGPMIAVTSPGQIEILK